MNVPPYTLMAAPEPSFSAAAAFVKVAEAAVTTFSEVRDGKTGWGQFAAIIVVGVVLLVAVIWLLGKSANIIL